MQRTPRLRLGSMVDVSGAGSLIRSVRRRPTRLGFLRALCVSVVIFYFHHRGTEATESFVGQLRRGANFFSCISRASRLHPWRSDIAGRHCVFGGSEGPEIFE
jgi:hypothetical protein